ncbi:MAG TPA: GntR family transcriptional regulator [Capsulimonadaceae bacterium]
MLVTAPKTRPKRLGRPADRKDELVVCLRDSIISGELQPGGRMPTREQIIQRFSASPVTVNSALAELRDSGFVEVRGNQGTFVAGILPHQTRYAIAFGMESDDTAGMGYTASLARESARVSKTVVDHRELEIVPFYGLDRSWEAPDFVALMAEVRAHRIAGIIAANFIPEVVYAEDVVANNVPIVANVGSLVATECSTVQFDGASAAKMAFEYLAKRGVRRPGMIFSVKTNQLASSTWTDCAAAVGILIEPYLIQRSHLAAPSAAQSSAHLMMMLDDSRRPDALIIVDDNLVPHAVAGLIDAGITADDGFPIVAHANFPWPTECPLPAARVGYDLRQMIETCVGIIDRMRSNGNEVEHLTILPTMQLSKN